MTPAELRTKLRRFAGQSSLVLPDEVCDDCINTAVERVQQAHDWQLQQTATTRLGYLPTDDGIALPGDFVQETLVATLNESETDPTRRLTLVPKLDTGRRGWVERYNAPSHNERFPRPTITGLLYYVFGGKLYLVPAPSEAVALEVDYLANQNDVTSVATNAFLTAYPRLVQWGAYLVATIYLQDWALHDHVQPTFDALLIAAIKRDVGQRVSGGPKGRGV